MKEVVIEHDNSEVAYYMPHHGVLRPEKSTTKLRVVFNATNSYKEHPYAFTADVKMMYRMILIHESQQPLLRILWKESPEDPVKTFEMKTVTYGTGPVVAKAKGSSCRVFGVLKSTGSTSCFWREPKSGIVSRGLQQCSLSALVDVLCILKRTRVELHGFADASEKNVTEQ
ncbi:uncharacterized protein TNCV_4750481 [Trichonephila clavipes]|nr:uncharacterized protein TNCV_4750481 [Trichonephila clavipes]